MIIGTSRIGIGRIGIRSGNYEELPFTTNASILERILADFTTNATIVQATLLSLTTDADILDGWQRQFTTNASIIEAIDAALPTNAYIAVLTALGFTTNASIVVTAAKTFTTNASILAPVVRSLTTNASICGPVTMPGLPTNAYICIQTPLELPTNAYISEHVTSDITTDAYIALVTQSTLTTSAYIVDFHSWKIGPENGNLIDISERVADPAPKGFDIDCSHQRIPGGRRTTLLDKGLIGAEYSFNVYFLSDEARQAFHVYCNNNSEDMILYTGRSDRFYYIKKMSINPLKDKRYSGPASKVVCWLEDPHIYHDVDQGIDLGACPLPQDSLSKYNYGTASAPMLFRIGGLLDGTTQLTFPRVKCLDGATEETSLYLGPGLLSNDYSELTREGAAKYFLVHTYADDFNNNNYWQYDVVQSLCSLAGGQVSVPAGGYFYYLFQGHPLKDEIELLATITVSAGSPIIQYSTDGSTWHTAIAASEIMSGIQTTYYLTGTEKRSTVYVRFYSPAGAAMTVQDVSFNMERDISAQADQIPMIPPGESRILRVTGSGSSKAKIDDTFRARWYAQ
jgi:hypothetical protein